MIHRKNTSFICTVILISLFAIQAPAYGQSPASNALKLPKQDVYKKVLDNGLTALIMEKPDVDMVYVEARVKAGSALEEEYSGAGISHFVEHMLFKGTKTRPPGAIAKEVRSYGGYINASTSLDTTVYYVTALPQHLSNVLNLLKDMVMNAAFPEDEFEKEREVIIKEIKLHRDNPQRRISTLLWKTSYIRHPYRHPIIGYEELFRRVKREDLVKYYSRMYVPNRMVLSITGNVDKREAMSLVEKEFRDSRPSDYRPIKSEREPMQIARRSLEEEAAINLSYLSLGFHSTSVLNEDLFALDVLAIILGQGDESRLNRSLFKEKGLVYHISSYNYTPRDPGLFMITSILDKENLKEARESILAEVERLKEGYVTDEELERARRAVLSGYIFSRQTIGGIASDLSSNEALTGSYDFSRRYVDGIQGVTKEGVKAAAIEYLTDDNLTVVSLVPEKSPGETREDTTKARSPKRVTRKETLPNGIRILTTEKRGTPVVSITVACLGGVRVEDKDNNGISNLTAKMILRGTQERTEDKIKGAVENLGGSISSFSGLNSFGVNIRLMKGDVDFGIEILKDILANSKFPEAEMEKEKRRILASIKDEEDDIFQKGMTSFKRTLFESHPYGLRVIGQEETVRAIKSDELVSVYKSWYVPANFVISAAGDIDSAEMIEKIKVAFGDIEAREAPEAHPAREETLTDIKRVELEMDKEESLILLGYKTITVDDEDRYAFEVLASLCSGQGGRLFEGLREKYGLAYTLGCAQAWGIDPGYFLFYIATTKDKLSSAKSRLMEEVRRMKTKGISDEELESTKKKLISGNRLSLQTNESISFQTALNELYGLGYDNIYRYDANIEKVTKEDVARILKKYLPQDAYVEVTITGKK